VGAAFCPGIMEAYVTGVSKGTTPTTFSPNETVTRVQMTTFLQRSLDQGLTRASRRAALNQWWSPQTPTVMQAIPLGASAPNACASDGEDVWTSAGNEVVQVRSSSGAVVGTWTNANAAWGVQAAAGRVYVVGNTSPGSLYMIDPTQAPGPVTTVASNLGGLPEGIAFDGTHLWTANYNGSVSIITLQAATPYPVTTVTTGFTNPDGILYDGANIWVTDYGAAKLFKLDAGGAILQTVTVGNWPAFPAFDGANIWVPNYLDNTVTVVQASTGNVVATLVDDANNDIHCPNQLSFDGERMFLTNHTGDSVTVFKAADLSIITNVPMGPFSTPAGTCSDGINFWFTVTSPNSLLRF
jgi:DNA-binding beta-propeller fold protein YncE